MANKRIWIELFVACLLSSALVHAIPEGYEVRQTYSVTGSAGTTSEISSRLSAVIRTTLRDEGVETDAVQRFRCLPGSTPDRSGCSTSTGRRSRAWDLSALLKETVPAKIGWLPAETLRTRLAETKERLAQWNREVADAVTELGTLELQITQSRKQLAAARSKKASLENDLSNRRRQLTILEEAIPEQTADATRKRFESKRVEVLGILQSLALQIDRADREILSLSAPSERKAEIEEMLPNLRAQIDLAQAQIASWTSLLSGAKGEALLADPNGFQLAPLSGSPPVVPLRSWTHLLWSFPLGLLVLAVVRRKKLSGWRSRYFESPEEVTSETGLPFLGRL